jgi:hypothetical protein
MLLFKAAYLSQGYSRVLGRGRLKFLELRFHALRWIRVRVMEAKRKGGSRGHPRATRERRRSRSQEIDPPAELP